jgi:heme O synthase-like polyprenyltransferase
LLQGFSGPRVNDRDAHDLGPAGPASSKWARQVFLASIVYLPILFATMVYSGQA